MAKEPEPEEKESDKEDAKDAPASSAPKSGMLIVIIVGFLVMTLTPLITFFVVKMTMKPTLEEHQAATTEKKKEGGGHGAKKKEGGGHGGGHGAKKEGGGSESAQPVFDVEPVVVNIENTQGTRYLKVAAHLVVSESGMLEELKANKAMVKDRIIMAIGNKSIGDLEGEKGRESVKREIKQRINAEFNGKMAGTIINVYFSEYLIQ